jgi:hypothetical protein
LLDYNIHQGILLWTVPTRFIPRFRAAPHAALPKNRGNMRLNKGQEYTEEIRGYFHKTDKKSTANRYESQVK